MAEIDREYVEALLSAANLLEDDGKLNDDGKQVLAITLTDFLPERHGPAFEPIKRKAGRVVAVEAVIIDVEMAAVLLGWRVHEVFGEGWHTFGTYPEEDELMTDAVKRCAKNEAGVDIEVVRQIVTKDHPYNQRFPDASVLYLCRITDGEIKNLTTEGEPKPNDCRWFSKCPPNMLPIQEDYREHIDHTIWQEVETARILDEAEQNVQTYSHDWIGR